MSKPLSDLLDRGQRVGLFVSDLHLFSQRSVGHVRMDGLQTTFPDADLLVLGGDVFDFKWSQLGSFPETLVAAENWFHQLMNDWQGDVLFLPGNHDCVPAFLDKVECRISKLDRFYWRPHCAQLGDAVFLHGDVLDSQFGLNQLESYRARFHDEQPQSPMAHRMYQVAVAMRIHRAIPKIRHTTAKTCEKLLKWIPEISDDPSAVRRAFFGHTHVAINGDTCGGVEFYNPGAALKHLSFQPVRFQLGR
jgi:UDP-2,3-diacylglucosamine pyrophosphatase LpxH